MTETPNYLKYMRDEPVEVWQAVQGDPSELITLLRSNVDLTTETREALALWLEGRLPPKNRVGRPRKTRAPGNFPPEVWIELAVQRFKRVAEACKKRGSFYGKAELLLEAIARNHDIDVRTLRNAVYSEPPSAPEPTTDPIERFQIWRRQNVRENPQK